MYLPSYKINNSYTVYVNYFYLNECIKAGKNQITKKPNYSFEKIAKPTATVTPLSPNTLLKHKRYGIGRVVSTDKDGIMKVAFETKVLHFIYPDSIRKRYLSVVSQ